jgi:hypothetical protein
MDETRLYFRAHSNNTLAQGNVKGWKLQKECVTLALDVNLIGTDKLKLLVTYASEQPQCFGRWQPHEYVRWHSNKTTWMKGDIFEDWILKLNSQFKGRNRKVIMILDNASSHVVSSAKVGKSWGFPTMELSNMTLVFLPPNVTSVVQPLDQGIIASFKIQYKKKLLEWVLSQYDDTTLKDLRKMVPNIRQAIMWGELDAQIVRNCWRMTHILPTTWNVDFALVDEREKNRMQEESNEFGAQISNLQLGDDEMSIET